MRPVHSGHRPVAVQRERFRRPGHEEDAAPRRRHDDRAAFPAASGKPDPTEVLEICGGVLEAGTKPLVKADKLKGKATVAVDEHAIPRRDRGKSDDLKGGKRKGGTNNFECHMTVQVVSDESSVTRSSYQAANGEPQSHYLGALIENARVLGVNVGLVLLDRGFNPVANILEMDAQGVRYVVPKSGYHKVYRAMEEAKADTDRAVRPYAMTARDGTATTLTMATVPKKIKPCRAKCGECKSASPS